MSLPIIVVVEDYTHLPAGTETKRGKTGECPICHKTALIENLGEKTSYLHRLLFTFDEEKGIAKTGEEACITETSKKAP